MRVRAGSSPPIPSPTMSASGAAPCGPRLPSAGNGSGREAPADGSTEEEPDEVAGERRDEPDRDHLEGGPELAAARRVRAFETREGQDGRAGHERDRRGDGDR